MKAMLGAFLLTVISAWAALGQEATVTAARANLRGAPSGSGRVLSQVVRGTNVTVLVERAQWYLVQTDDEFIGWIHESTIAFDGRVEKNVVPPSVPDRYIVKGDINLGTAGASPSSTPRPSAPRVVSGGVLNGKAETLPKPSYPAAARAVRASGAVSVYVLIGENGTVESATAVSGHPLLREAAVYAARAAAFRPTYISGRPVKVSGEIVYNFVP